MKNCKKKMVFGRLRDFFLTLFGQSNEVLTNVVYQDLWTKVEVQHSNPSWFQLFGAMSSFWSLPLQSLSRWVREGTSKQATDRIIVASIFSRVLLAEISKEPSHFIFWVVLLAGVIGLLQCVVRFSGHAKQWRVEILLTLVQCSLDCDLCLE